MVTRTAPRTLEGRTLDRHHAATAVSTAETTLHPGTRHDLSDTVNPLTVRKRLDNGSMNPAA
jgi:hypothetical protein